MNSTNNKKEKVPVEIEFTEGYEKRFTAAVLKIYADRKNKETKKKSIAV